MCCCTLVLTYNIGEEKKKKKKKKRERKREQSLKEREFMAIPDLVFEVDISFCFDESICGS